MVYTTSLLKKILIADGWFLVRTTKHENYRHKIKKGTIQLSKSPNKYVPIKISKKILRLAQITEDKNL